MKTYQIFLITTLITLTTQIKTEMSNKIKKSKTLQTTYGDIITIESIRFEDTCYALSEGYSFLLDITQTDSNYPLIINSEIYLILETDSSISIPCSCVSNKDSSYLNCTLDKDLSSTNYNNKNFRLKKSNDIEFSCSKSESVTIEKCLIKSFDISDTITYHNLYDVLSKEQNNTYVIDFGNVNYGIIYVKFDTFVMGEGPLITLDGTEIKNCEELSYNDNEDEGQFIKCNITKEQFDVDNYQKKNVVVINQCNGEEYPGITVVLMKSKGNYSKFINVNFLFVLFFILGLA